MSKTVNGMEAPSSTIYALQVPFLLQEEAVTEVPQQQVVEVKREDLQPIAEEVVKQVPRFLVIAVASHHCWSLSKIEMFFLDTDSEVGRFK